MFQSPRGEFWFRNDWRMGMFRSRRRSFSLLAENFGLETSWNKAVIAATSRFSLLAENFGLETIETTEINEKPHGFSLLAENFGLETISTRDKEDILDKFQSPRGEFWFRNLLDLLC